MSVQGEGIALGGTPISVSALNVTENGTYTPSAGAAYNVVNVNVEQPFSFVVKGNGSFKTSGDVNVNFGDTSSDYSGSSQTVSFSYNDEKAHRIVVTGNLTFISFENCTALISVDVPFPSSMDRATFSRRFYGCTSLVAIPSGLFDNCPSMKDCNNIFRGCSSLTAIPGGLFDRCTAITGFGGCFQHCSALTSIPSGLFDNCTAVTSFNFCFQGCTSLTGLAPELWDITKWANVTSHDDCFEYCTGLSNYADIPSDWK